MEECSKASCRYPATEEFKGSRYCYKCWEVLKFEESQRKPKICSEPGCRYPVTHDFHGKKLCHSCWAKYKAEEAKTEAEIRWVRW
jgi:hypothetical protein